jgi:predicted N-acetyltransferase YhbS
MLWENVDMFGDEQKILEMMYLAVAEKHGKKGLATSLVKVGTSLLCIKFSTQAM